MVKVYNLEKKEDYAIILLGELIDEYQDAQMYYERGRIYYNQGETTKASEDFLNAIKIDPNNANALYSMGLSLELLNREQEALIYFEKVLELNPESEDVKARIKKIKNLQVMPKGQ